MYPKLLELDFPLFIQLIINTKKIIIYSYPFMILIGVLTALIFLKIKKNITEKLTSINFIFFIICAVYLGGKFFLLLENPLKYINNPNLILNIILTSGFVFYGSLIFAILGTFYYLKKDRKEFLKNIDFLTLAMLIIHFFGRIGCFLAGCCYGKKTTSILGIKFPNKENYLHPTQLYEAISIFLIFITIIYIKKHKKFNGQLFLTYLILYSGLRFIIEIFRGDFRGNFQNLLSHSQLIAICLLIFSYIYFKFLKKSSKI